MFGAERLAGLVLVDSSVGEEPAPTGRRHVSADRCATTATRRLDGFVRAIFKHAPNESEVIGLVKGAKRISVENSIALLSYPFPRTHWKQIVHAYTKPLLYIVTPQFAEQAKNLQKNRPATEIEVFRDAGHTLFVDEPERFNALITRFAQSLSSR